MYALIDLGIDEEARSRIMTLRREEEKQCSMIASFEKGSMSLWGGIWIDSVLNWSISSQKYNKRTLLGKKLLRSDSAVYS
ncbi:hypothetical protein GcC1_094012 [Golovinomyces cichoracearum]|uniref:Uncharacterized protein n=1 Tax=Golovinomyces cichoracearum TaxID=62708 RepID=A0A420ID66_9PEZI|nr:hypothetical protein GcC1_094012 [Golovinomyces cichoracearum]